MKDVPSLCINPFGGRRTGAGVRGAAPLADDLGVGLHQVVRNVSARQVLQGVCGAELLLHKHKGETVSSSQPPTKLPPGVKGSKVRGVGFGAVGFGV